MTHPEFELVVLKNGESSILSRRHGETMHIGSSPRCEALALHIGQQKVVERLQSRTSSAPFVIWDVGLGPAGNALTAIEFLRGPETGRPIELHSFDLSTDILEFALRHAGRLGYLAGWESTIAALLADGVAFPAPHLCWRLHRGDFAERMASAPPPDAIFHDPYSPAKNPEMWSVGLFRAMRERAGGRATMLTNYTRSTAVRVSLALAGWVVGLGAATGEKDQTTVAANDPGLIERPLDRHWLGRVRRSTNAAPFRNGVYAPGPISDDDFAALTQAPQFRETSLEADQCPQRAIPLFSR